MAAFPEPHTIGLQVYSTAGDDGRGNPVASWAAAVSKPAYAIYPGTPGEDYEPGRNPSKIPMFVLGSKDALGTVQARDRIVIGSDTFDVDGAPEDFTLGPFGFEPGVRIRLMRVEG